VAVVDVVEDAAAGAALKVASLAPRVTGVVEYVAESSTKRVGKKTTGRSVKLGCTARFNVVIQEDSGMAVVTYTQHRHVDAAGLPCHDAGVRDACGLACAQSQERIDFVAAHLVQGVAVPRIIERECHCFVRVPMFSAIV
jgi:hypothetical protein